MCTMGGPGAHRSQGKALALLELEFETVVSCHVDVGNQTQVPYKSSQCSNH